MQHRSMPSRSQEQQQRALFLFVVVVGYIVTFTVASRGGLQLSIYEVVSGILFGVVYLVFGFFDREILGRLSFRYREALYFSVQILSVLGIGWLLGPGGNWLIGLPLAGMAVERLPGPRRWARD